ncbi:xanthine dehydrogenase accessory protein XdhC [Trinickia dabaoshanensis]|uniref:Xanthine dehydrogenase accessory protein XdhC n=1 Tax=Trinickia dabaoshanensis TaxID=564714 RepID=A0A2N7VPR8_9BURK|nr:xanthine dehydrogenase accessory protein XdhC [Trinickia dabaoshanensis]PMS19117.1 xanthine dehydrogenase accessory protein XdhC [Trinickia dabaoshanensis]
MQPWLTELQQLLTHGDAVVLVTVARVEGSTPREAGAKMIVTRESARHTIGGGHLEWRAIEIAREVLRDGMRVPRLRRLERLSLGPSLGQCCGGAVVLAFERLDVGDLDWVAALGKSIQAGKATQRSVSFGPLHEPVRLAPLDTGIQAPECLLWDGSGFDEGNALLTETIVSRDVPVVLFGAGHVATAFARVLATLPCRVRWVDERDAQFPPKQALVDWNNVTIDARQTPEHAVDDAAPGTAFVVMTHNHARDLVLAERILRRGDFLFFGMIGSRTKRRQFDERLAAFGIDGASLARMVCPIGIEGIDDKAPEVIALSAAAQLLQAIEAARAAPPAVPDQPFSMLQPLTDHDTELS